MIDSLILIPVFAGCVPVYKELKFIMETKIDLPSIYEPIILRNEVNQHISSSCLCSFDWHSQVPQSMVKVQRGCVTLEGDVDWNYQSQAAERAVETISDVKGVSNLIRVKPQVIAQLISLDFR